MIFFDERIFTIIAYLLSSIAGGMVGFIVFLLAGGEGYLAWIGGVITAALTGYIIASIFEKIGWI